MVKDEIKLNLQVESFDKKQIALAIRNSTLGDKMRCSLLAEGIIKQCEGCTLSCICEWIDDALESYVEATTNVVSSFSVGETE